MPKTFYQITKNEKHTLKRKKKLEKQLINKKEIREKVESRNKRIEKQK